MEIDEMIKELNENRPTAYFHGVPVYAKDFVPEGEVWFIPRVEDDKACKITHLWTTK